jgi:hypothetical protein
VRVFRKKVRGWSINVEVEVKKQKKELSDEYNRLDILDETQGLSSLERIKKQQLAEELNKI